ncbi:MAG: hypothetical protein ACFB21_04635 [Opitutales bacterium]
MNLFSILTLCLGAPFVLGATVASPAALRVVQYRDGLLESEGQQSAMLSRELGGDRQSPNWSSAKRKQAPSGVL